jgi:hypothetical protein
VLTHWKEREPVYRHRHDRIAAEFGGIVPPYASTGSDVEPRERAARRRAARLTEPASDNVSADEFEQLKRDIAEEEAEPSRRRASTLTRRMARTSDEELEAESQQAPSRRRSRSELPRKSQRSAPDPEAAAPGDAPPNGEAGDAFEHAPDEVENEGMLPGDDTRQPRPPRGGGTSRRSTRNRRHGRR